MESKAPAVVHVAAEIFERYPSYRAHVIYASGLLNGPSDGETTRMWKEAQESVRLRFASQPLSELPHVEAWRAAYSGFGSKPSRYPSSVEALMRRALKGALPCISRLVDLYNAVSLTHMAPVGGEDLSRIAGRPVLRFAEGGEPFEAREGGESVVTPVDKGEVIWVDDGGVTCRRWNWRQCARTAITGETTDAYFVIDALDPFTSAELDAATEALVGGLRSLSPGCAVQVEVLGAKETAPSAH